MKQRTILILTLTTICFYLFGQDMSISSSAKKAKMWYFNHVVLNEFYFKQYTDHYLKEQCTSYKCNLLNKMNIDYSSQSNVYYTDIENIEANMHKNDVNHGVKVRISPFRKEMKVSNKYTNYISNSIGGKIKF